MTTPSVPAGGEIGSSPKNNSLLFTAALLAMIAGIVQAVVGIVTFVITLFNVESFAFIEGKTVAFIFGCLEVILRGVLFIAVAAGLQCLARIERHLRNTR